MALGCESRGQPSVDALEFAVAVLAVWRVTHLLAYEDGPADVVAGARARLGNSLVGQLVDCFDCLGIWVAAVFALTFGRRQHRLIRVLATSGATSLLERATADAAAVTIEPLD